jgi:hypothetical protein
MATFRARFIQRRQQRPNGVVPLSAHPPIAMSHSVRLRLAPDRLADPRTWPEWLTDRTALRAVVDDAEHFSATQRALAWQILTYDPRHDLALKAQVMARANVVMRERTACARWLGRQGVRDVMFDDDTAQSFLRRHPNAQTNDGDYNAALREVFAMVGARLIMDDPQLTDRQLDRAVYRAVADELEASVLIDDPTLTTAERKTTKRIWLKTTAAESWARTWDKQREEWVPLVGTRYVRLVTRESDLATAMLDADDDQAELDLLDHGIGEPLWMPPAEIPASLGGPETERDQARETARDLFHRLQPMMTPRQQIAVMRRARGKRSSANERQAICEVRRKFRRYQAESRRLLGWRETK